MAVKVLDPPSSSSLAAATGRSVARDNLPPDEIHTESAALHAVRGLPHCLQLIQELQAPSVQHSAGGAAAPLPAGVRATVTELAASDLLAVMIGVTSLVRQLAAPPGMDASLLPLIPIDAPLRSQSPPTPAWHEGFARHFLLQAISGLQAAAGAGVFHRDVKLENFLIGSAGQLLLADFGLAHVAPKGVKEGSFCSEEPLLSTYCCGTPMYKAPEMLSGSLLQRQLGLWEPPGRRTPPLGAAAAGSSSGSSSSHSSFSVAPPTGYDVRKVDTWSLGVVFLQLVSGGVPPWGHTGARLQSLAGPFYAFTKQPASILKVFRAPEDPPKVDGCAALSRMGRTTLLHLLQVSPAARPSVQQLAPAAMPHSTHDDVRTYLDGSTGRLGDDAVLQHLLAILPAVQQAARSTLGEVQRQRQERAAQRTAHAHIGGPLQRQHAATTASNPSAGSTSHTMGQPAAAAAAAAAASGSTAIPPTGASPMQAQLATAPATVPPHSAGIGGVVQWGGGGGSAPLSSPPAVGVPGVAFSLAQGYVGHSGTDTDVGASSSGNVTPLAPPEGYTPPQAQVLGPSSTTEAPPPGQTATRGSLLHPLKAPPTSSSPLSPSPAAAAAAAAVGAGAPPPKAPGQMDLIEKVVTDEEAELHEPPPSGPLRTPVYRQRGGANPLQQLAAAAAGAQHDAAFTILPPERGALDFIPQGAFLFRMSKEHASDEIPSNALSAVAAAIKRHLGFCELQLQLDTAEIGGSVTVTFHESSSAPLQPVPWAQEGNVCTSAVSVELSPEGLAAATGQAGAVPAQLQECPRIRQRFEVTWAMQAKAAVASEAPWESGGSGGGGGGAVLLWGAPCISIATQAPRVQGSHVAALGCSGSMGRAIGALAAAATDIAACSGVAAGLSASLQDGIAAAATAGSGVGRTESDAIASITTGAANGLRQWLEQRGAELLAHMAWRSAVAVAVASLPPSVDSVWPAGEAVAQLLARRAASSVSHAVPAARQVHEVVPVLFSAAGAQEGGAEGPPAEVRAAACAPLEATGDAPQGMLRLGSTDSYSELM